VQLTIFKESIVKEIAVYAGKLAATIAVVYVGVRVIEFAETYRYKYKQQKLEKAMEELASRKVQGAK
jgi:hypothetical protein